jgi:hypothetical protein
MPFAPGNIEARSFPAIRTLPEKPDPSSIFTNVSERALHWLPMITSSAQTKRPVFKPAAAKQPTLPPAPNRPTYVEHEYFRMGAWTYLAAWDVYRARVVGRCEVKSGIAPVNRLVGEIMGQDPYKSARRVFWIMDNCSAHRGQKAANRLRDKRPNLILIHTPVHASWLEPGRNLFLDREELTSV